MGTPLKPQDIPLNSIISTHEDEDDWLVIDTDNSTTAVNDPHMAEKWLMVEDKAKKNQAKDILKVNQKAKSIMELPMIVNSSGISSSEMDVKDTCVNKPNTLEIEVVELVPQRGIDYYPSARATLQAAREGIEQYREKQFKLMGQFVANAETEKEKVAFGLKQPRTPLASLQTQRAGTTSMSDRLEFLYPPAETHDDHPEIWYHQPEASSSKRFLLPEPEQVVKAIPAQGISSTDIIWKFSHSWPPLKEDFPAWTEHFKALVKSVAVYDSDTQFVKPKPKLTSATLITDDAKS